MSSRMNMRVGYSHSRVTSNERLLRHCDTAYCCAAFPCAAPCPAALLRRPVPCCCAVPLCCALPCSLLLSSDPLLRRVLCCALLLLRRVLCCCAAAPSCSLVPPCRCAALSGLAVAASALSPLLVLRGLTRRPPGPPAPCPAPGARWRGTPRLPG